MKKNLYFDVLRLDAGQNVHPGCALTDDIHSFSISFMPQGNGQILRAAGVSGVTQAPYSLRPVQQQGLQLELWPQVQAQADCSAQAEKEVELPWCQQRLRQAPTAHCCSKYCIQLVSFKRPTQCSDDASRQLLAVMTGQPKQLQAAEARQAHDRGKAGTQTAIWHLHIAVALYCLVGWNASLTLCSLLMMHLHLSPQVKLSRPLLLPAITGVRDVLVMLQNTVHKLCPACHEPASQARSSSSVPVQLLPAKIPVTPCPQAQLGWLVRQLHRQ